MDRHRATRERRLVRPRYLAVGGALLFLSAVIAFMGIITAEALYPPGYSTSANEISDLGATKPPDSVIEQPSATIFNLSMIVCGVLIVGGAFCAQRGFRRVAAPLFLALFGIGVVGVGVFPGDYGTIHALFALLTFAAGGVAAIVSLTVETAPLRYFSMVLGAVALVTLVLEIILGESNPMRALGVGGVERWVAYPLLLWLAGLGGHMMGRGR